MVVAKQRSCLTTKYLELTDQPVVVAFKLREGRLSAARARHTDDEERLGGRGAGRRGFKYITYRHQCRLRTVSNEIRRFGAHWT